MRSDRATLPNAILQASPGALRWVKRLRTVAPAAALLIATFLVYWPALGGGMIWDDRVYLRDNLLLRDPRGWWRLWAPGLTPQYYPLVFLGFWIEYRLWGLEPLGYHVVNVALHAMNAILIWQITRRLKIPGAWMIAAVFALHPMHVESVAYISERKNVLSALCYLASALAYFQFDSPTASNPAFTRRPWRWYLLSLLLFVMALLGKTVTCTLPIALALVLLAWKRPHWRQFLPLLPFGVIGALLAMQTVRVEQATVGAVGPEFSFSIAQRLLIASRALLFYPWKLLWPSELCFIYPRWEIEPARWTQWWPAAAIIVAGAPLVLLWRMGWRKSAIGPVFFGLTIGPALGLISYYPMRFSFVADHFAYLASLGVLAAVIAGAARALPSRTVAATVGAGLLVLLGILTSIQSRMYQDDVALWRWTVRLNDQAWIAHHNLAVALVNRGLPDDAERHFRSALALHPSYHEGHQALGDLLLRLGRLEEALSEYRLALESLAPIEPSLLAHLPAFRDNPPSAQYHLRIGQVLDQLGRAAEAERAYRTALEIAPRRVEMIVGLAAHWSARERLEEAAAVLRAGLDVQPRRAELHGRLAAVLRAMHEDEQALAHLRCAVDLANGAIERLTAKRELADLLATSDVLGVRHGPEAVALAEEVAAATDRRDPLALMTLAAALAEVGRLDAATATGEEGLRQARHLGADELARQLESRLQAIRAGRPGLQQPHR